MKKLLVICGPTASGKSALAVECAKRLNGEIVSADAFLIYRGLDIGTAKPTEEERQGIRHHLIDVADPRDSFSVSDYERLATDAVGDILARGKTPVLCGGTGFYMQSVLFSHAYGDAPANAEIRERYERLAREQGKEAVHARLSEIDPESAQTLHPNDVKRVIRAIEIFEQTGKKKSAQTDGDTPRYPFEAVMFDYPREELYARIGRRTGEMLKAGLVEEVERLLLDGVPENAQSMQGIGYKEVVEFLKNRGERGTLSDIEESTLSDIISKNTRNYAKRQLTFFRRMPALHRLAPSAAEVAAQEVIEIYEGRR